MGAATHHGTSPYPDPSDSAELQLGQDLSNKESRGVRVRVKVRPVQLGAPRGATSLPELLVLLLQLHGIWL